jgi:hypothetical protein
MSHPAFFKLIVLSENEYGFGTDCDIHPTLASAYRTGESILGAENVYGYVIVRIEHDSWSVVGECVYGCDYTVYEHNGKVSVKKGRDRLVMV